MKIDADDRELLKSVERSEANSDGGGKGEGIRYPPTPWRRFARIGV